MKTSELIKILKKLSKAHGVDPAIGQLRLDADGNFYTFKSVEVVELASGEKIIDLQLY